MTTMTDLRLPPPLWIPLWQAGLLVLLGLLGAVLLAFG